MDRAAALISTLLVGGLVALQPPANAALAEHVGDLGAAFISVAISFAVIVILLVVVGDPGRLSGLSGFRPEHAIGGLAGAAVVTVSLIAVRPLGIGGVTAALVGAQLIVSVIADRFGVLGVHKIQIGWQQVLGVALVIAGTFLITRP
jgi:transporter family-2 protein